MMDLPQRFKQEFLQVYLQMLPIPKHLMPQVQMEKLKGTAKQSLLVSSSSILFPFILGAHDEHSHHRSRDIGTSIPSYPPFVLYLLRRIVVLIVVVRKGVVATVCDSTRQWWRSR